MVIEKEDGTVFAYDSARADTRRMAATAPSGRTAVRFRQGTMVVVPAPQVRKRQRGRLIGDRVGWGDPKNRCGAPISRFRAADRRAALAEALEA